MTNNCEFNIDKIIIQSDQIEKRVAELAFEINNYYMDKKQFIIISVLKGSFIFLADLVRKINLNTLIDFISVSSYGSNLVSSGNITIKKDICMDITGSNVLLVEDIVDTGHTISRIKEYLIEKGSIDVKICSLLDKPSRRETDVVVDFCGFTVPDVFVVGYGLDASENYRNLPYIALVKQI